MKAFEVNKIFKVDNLTFPTLALEVFHYQYEHNIIYHQFVNSLKKDITTIQHWRQIPFLPIQFFKNNAIKTTEFEAQQIFTSSGTTGVNTSKHYVKELSIYEQSFQNAFQQFYGNIEEYCVLGLLPSYLEREGSSLIYMVNDLIKKSDHPLSDFYLDEWEHLYLILNELEKDKQPTILFGVTFALIDFATKFNMNLEHTIIMETGGMKGRGKEWTKEQLYQFLQEKLNPKGIHSEYGMTELLSQAYAKENGIFTTPQWMKAIVRKEDDPLEVNEYGKGILNIIDLANIYSCSFIATDDLTKINENGTFEVLGRVDNSDIRGCSLLTV